MPDKVPNKPGGKKDKGTNKPKDPGGGKKKKEISETNRAA